MDYSNNFCTALPEIFCFNFNSCLVCYYTQHRCCCCGSRQLSEQVSTFCLQQRLVQELGINCNTAELMKPQTYFFRGWYKIFSGVPLPLWYGTHPDFLWLPRSPDSHIGIMIATFTKRWGHKVDNVNSPLGEMIYEHVNIPFPI